jgi:1,4-alpha-glucan branching enzyme
LYSAKLKERRKKMAKKSTKNTKTKAEQVRFDLFAPEAHKISLAGDFNGWDINSLPMEKDNEGNWKISINLRPGRYEYRFYADGAWQDDPKVQERVGTPFGSQNCVRFIT